MHETMMSALQTDLGSSGYKVIQIFYNNIYLF